MTPPIAGTIALGAALLIGLVARIMSMNIMAGSITAAVLLGPLVLYIPYRLIATGKGAHVAKRGYDEADERLADTHERVIPRAITEHDPPWEYQAAPVIEPAAITSGPPDDTEVIITATLSIQYPPGSSPWVGDRIRTGMGLPPWVAEELGHDSTDDALDSMFNRAMARQVRALTDGAP